MTHYYAFFGIEIVYIKIRDEHLKNIYLEFHVDFMMSTLTKVNKLKTSHILFQNKQIQPHCLGLLTAERGSGILFRFTRTRYSFNV